MNKDKTLFAIKLAALATVVVAGTIGLVAGIRRPDAVLWDPATNPNLDTTPSHD